MSCNKERCWVWEEEPNNGIIPYFQIRDCLVYDESCKCKELGRHQLTNNQCKCCVLPKAYRPTPSFVKKPNLKVCIGGMRTDEAIGHYQAKGSKQTMEIAPQSEEVIEAPTCCTHWEGPTDNETVMQMLYGS